MGVVSLFIASIDLASSVQTMSNSCFSRCPTPVSNSIFHVRKYAILVNLPSREVHRLDRFAFLHRLKRLLDSVSALARFIRVGHSTPSQASLKFRIGSAKEQFLVVTGACSFSSLVGQ
jgi:hypothetical protein